MMAPMTPHMATENVSSSVKPARVAQRTANQIPMSVPTAVKKPCQVICSGNPNPSQRKSVGSILIGMPPSSAMGASSSGRDNSIVGLFDWLGRKRQKAPPSPLVWSVRREASEVVVEDGRGGVF